MKRVALLFFACAFSLSACGGNRENLAEVGDAGFCLAEAESGSSGDNLAGEEREVEQKDFLGGWSLKLDGGLEEYYGLLRKGAETGETIYMRKTNVVTWLASGSTWYLQMNFYLFHEEKQEIIELEDMEVNHGGHAKIVQLWFQEIGGKTIMFRVYNLSAFNYLLNTAVIENGEIRSLRNDIFSPEMAFEILLDEAEPI